MSTTLLAKLAKKGSLPIGLLVAALLHSPDIKYLGDKIGEKAQNGTQKGIEYVSKFYFIKQIQNVPNWIAKIVSIPIKIGGNP